MAQGSSGYGGGPDGEAAIVFPAPAAAAAAAATVQTTGHVARRHGSVAQTALQKQIKVFEDRLSNELSNLGSSWATPTSGHPSSSPSPAATQAALAGALEACVDRIAESEAYVAALDMEVRQLRVESQRSKQVLDGLTAQLELSLALPSETLQASETLSTLKSLEGEVRHLAFKFDAGDEELEQLTASRAELVSRQELADVAQTLRGDVDDLRENLGNLLLRTADPFIQQQRQESAEVSEPFMCRLDQLADFAAPAQASAQAPKDVEVLRGDLRMAKAVDNEIGDETKMDRECILFSTKSEFSDAIAELTESTQSLKVELRCLSDKVTYGSVAMAPQNGLEALTQLVKEEVKKISHGATRHELQAATQLLLEVKDAGKLLKKEIQSAEVPADAVVTRREFSTAMELWNRELGILSAQLSEQMTLAAPRELHSTALERQGSVTRQEVTDIIDVFRQEVEMLAKRVDKSENAVSRNELAETVKRLKQEQLVMASKAAHGDLVSRHQELLDVADLMKRELRSVAEKSVVTQQDLAGALEGLKREVSLRLQLPGSTPESEVSWLEAEPLVARMLGNLWSERFSVELKQDLRQEFESMLTRKEQGNASQQIQQMEMTLRTRFVNDISQVSTDLRHDITELTQRLGRVELAQRTDLESRSSDPALLTRIGAISDRLSAVEHSIGVGGGQGGESLSSIIASGLEQSHVDIETSKIVVPGETDAKTLARQDALDALSAALRGLSDRVASIEGNRQAASLSSDCSTAGTASSGINSQVPMLPLEQMHIEAPLSPGLPPKDSSGLEAQHLERIVQPLRKRIAELSDAVGKSSTPRASAGVSGEGVAQLMAVVKREQEQERVLVETLLARISTLCDRVGSVERKIVESAAENVQTSSQEAAPAADDLAAKIQAQEEMVAEVQEQIGEMVAEVQEQVGILKERVDSVEGKVGQGGAENLQTSSQQAAPDADDLAAKIQAQEEMVNEVQEQIGEMVAEVQEQVGDLKNRVDSIEGAVKSGSRKMMKRTVEDYLGADFSLTST